jgi:hypothetical protein
VPDIPPVTPIVAADPFANLYAGQGLWIRITPPGDRSARDEDPRAYLGEMAALRYQRRLATATTRDPYQASLNPAVYLARDATPGA